MASCINLQGSISGQQIFPFVFDKSVGTLNGSLLKGLEDFSLDVENKVKKDFFPKSMLYNRMKTTQFLALIY